MINARWIGWSRCWRRSANRSVRLLMMPSAAQNKLAMLEAPLAQKPDSALPDITRETGAGQLQSLIAELRAEPGHRQAQNLIKRTTRDWIPFDASKPPSPAGAVPRRPSADRFRLPWCWRVPSAATGHESAAACRDHGHPETVAQARAHGLSALNIRPRHHPLDQTPDRGLAHRRRPGLCCGIGHAGKLPEAPG